MVLMSEEKYVKEAKRQLGNPDIYLRLSSSPFLTLVEEFNCMLLLVQEDPITKKELNHLQISDYNISVLYTMPKLHKNPTGRPIVSAINAPLERVDQYIDSLLKTMVRALESYVRDTKDVLNTLGNIVIDDNWFLVGVDVESQYTSIPHHWGHKAVKFS